MQVAGTETEWGLIGGRRWSIATASSDLHTLYVLEGFRAGVTTQAVSKADGGESNLNGGKWFKRYGVYLLC
jgi:hypothetical protein